MADKTVVVRIVVRANQYARGLKGAAAQTQKFAVDVERSSAKAGSSALALGAASATAGKLMLVGIGGAMVVSAKAAIDFESSLAGVAKTTDLTGSAFAKANSPLAAFGEALRGLSMRIPVNVNELAKIAEIGGQLGIEVPNLIAFTETMAALGVTTNLTAEQAATGLARFANIMGTSQKDFERLGSIIVELGNNFATSESEILNFGLRLAPVAQSVGLTDAEVLALGTSMTSLGIAVERGGTALQRIFIDMSTAVLGGGESLQAFADATRLTKEEFADLFKKSPAEAFALLAKELDKTTEAGGNAAGVLKSVGVIQQRSINVLLASASGWEVIAEAIELANDESETATALQEEAATRYGTTASQIQILGNAFNDLRIEIGNALLGSGGLAAGIDFLRELVRIVKDHLPMLANLVNVMAIVAGFRIAGGMLTSLHAGFVGLKSMEGAAFGAARGTAALRLGMLGLNTAVFGAIGFAAILISNWAAAAAKAADLRRAAKELQDQIDAGTDPDEAIIDLLENQKILTADVLHILGDLNMSEEQLIRNLMKGDRITKDWRNTFGTTRDNVDEMATILGISADKARELLDLPETSLLVDTLLQAGEQLDAFLQFRSDKIRNGLMEAGAAGKFNADQLDRMSDAAARWLAIPIDDAVTKLLTPMTDPIRQAAMAVEHTEEATDSFSRSWRDLVLDTEEGADAIDDFTDAMETSVTDFKEALAEDFEDISEAIRKGFPAWDEYEQVTVESFDAVIAAQDLYLEDLREGLLLETSLIGEVGDSLLEFVRGLDPATKAALGRWRKTNTEEFEAWLVEVGDNLDEADKLTLDYWRIRLPESMEAGFVDMVATAAGLAAGLELPGKETADAFFEGLGIQMAGLSAEKKESFLAFVTEALEDEALLNALGVTLGDEFIQGLIDALAKLASKAVPVLNAEFRAIKESIEDSWSLGSASKVTHEYGVNIARGFFGGIEDEFQHQLQQASNPIVNVVGPKPVINLSTTVQGGSRDINLWYPEHTGDDVISGVKTGSLLTSLQREAEVVIGAG